MNERMMNFRLGVVVIAACVILGMLIVWFGERPTLLQAQYEVYIRLPYAPGVGEGTPVTKSGIRIGEVRNVNLESAEGGVVLTAIINSQYRLQTDSRPQLQRTFIGDSTVEFLPGKAKEFLQAGSRVDGDVAADPMEAIGKVADQTRQAAASVTATADQWRMVGERLNNLIRTNQEKLEKGLDQAITALEKFSDTMTGANQILGDPKTLENVRVALENMRVTSERMPRLVEEANETIVAARSAIAKADANLTHLEAVTKPLAVHAESVITKLDTGTTHLNELLVELTGFAKMLRNENGSLYRLTTDPNFATNLSLSAYHLATLLRDFRPVLDDLKVFSDKLARHPEKLGVQGLISPSAGTK